MRRKVPPACRAAYKATKGKKTRTQRGKALGRFSKCMAEHRRSRRSVRMRRGKHYKYWKGGWGED